jgi:hypothetical protein
MGSNPANGNGAYEDEMQEALVFMDALRAAVPAEPDPRARTALVPRLAATARAATLEAETRTARLGTAVAPRTARRPRSRLGLLLRVGTAVALIPLVLAGLAVAGVTVPSPARSAFDAIGIKLPNQPSKLGEKRAGDSASQPANQADGTQGAGTTTESSPQSQGNSTAAHEHAPAQHEKANGKALGHSHGKAVGLNEATPPGHSGETGPPANSNAGGNGRGASGSHGAANEAPKAPHTPNGVANGHSKTPPGQSKTPPGQSKKPPGHTKVPPGQAKK